MGVEDMPVTVHRSEQLPYVVSQLGLVHIETHIYQ